MQRTIAYDILRLFIGPCSLTPRGIDRVDLALARHIFDDISSNNIGVLPTPAGVFAYSSAQISRLLAYIQDLWAEDIQPTKDPQLQQLLNDITLGLVSQRSSPAARKLLFRHKVARMLHMLKTTGLVPRHLARHAVPRDAAYLNVGQLGLAIPSFFKWLNYRPDIARVAMLHDAIPVIYPHLVSRKAPQYHRQMILTAATRADALIFNSAYTRDSVRHVMREDGLECPPSLVQPLPLPAAFFEAQSTVADLSHTHYFLAVSTIEPRKNFDLLLRIWQQFVTTLGEAAPNLIIVGSPGNDAERIMAPLKSDSALARRVHYVSGLSSPSLASLVLGAAGMLCPSLAEGFGLPLLEASAMGVPCIASDIPAHREVATATTQLLPTDDASAWGRAILTLPMVIARRRPKLSNVTTEVEYCRHIINFASRVQSRNNYLT